MLEQHKAGAHTATRWPTPDASLVAYVKADRDKILQVYRIKPELIREHFGTEQSVLSSGYRYRQIFEVVQNAADAILEAADLGEGDGRILVRVTETHLYVGNTGAPRSAPKRTGDGVLLEFPSVVAAVECARCGLGDHLGDHLTSVNWSSSL